MEGKPNPHIAVFCVRTGGKYPADYVRRLRSMVRRHLGSAHDFYCLTDSEEPLGEGVAAVPLPGTDLGGCWNKLWLFSRGLVAEGTTMLYLDLDVVIVGSLDGLLAMSAAADFLGQPDWNRPLFPQFNSSVMRLRAGAQHGVLERFLHQIESGRLHRKDEWDRTTGSREKVVYWRGWRRFGGDQEWISAHLDPRLPIKKRAFAPGTIVSYKRHARGGAPAGASVVVFHGSPKPHEVNDVYVRENWK